jgi:hypothetical protein
MYLGEALVSPASDALSVLPDTTGQQHVTGTLILDWVSIGRDNVTLNILGLV